MENQRFKSCFKSIQELRLIQWALALTTKPQGQSSSEPHQLDVETLPSSRDSGGHGSPVASSYGSQWFFFCDRFILTAFLSMLIMMRIFIHSFHFGGREFWAIPIKNESPFSTSKLLDTLRNWQRSHLKRWNAASKARRQTSKRSSLWSFRVHTRYDIYYLQSTTIGPLGFDSKVTAAARLGQSCWHPGMNMRII